MQALGLGNRGRIAWRYRLVKSFPRKRRNRGLNGFGWRGEWREGYKPDREWQFKTRTLITESAAPKTNRAERLLAVSPNGPVTAHGSAQRVRRWRKSSLVFHRFEE